jgi:hypothetical protein
VIILDLFSFTFVSSSFVLRGSMSALSAILSRVSGRKMIVECFFVTKTLTREKITAPEGARLPVGMKEGWSPAL